MKMDRCGLKIVLVLLVFVSLACSSEITFFETPQSPSVETLVAGTLTILTKAAPEVTPTSTYPPTKTPIPASPTMEPFGEVYIYTIVDNANLRVKPGMLFQVSRVMAKDTRLKLLGQSPGGEWFNVMNDESIVGWVNVNVVSTGYDGPPPPVIQPTDVILITGHVVTELGTPVSGIGFVIEQGARRTDAMTDTTGQFYAYLPRTMNGTWTVRYISISCKSNTMDQNCNCINNVCGTAHPETASVTLPQSEPVDFVWK